MGSYIPQSTAGGVEMLRRRHYVCGAFLPCRYRYRTGIKVASEVKASLVPLFSSRSLSTSVCTVKTMRFCKLQSKAQMAARTFGGRDIWRPGEIPVIVKNMGQMAVGTFGGYAFTVRNEFLRVLTAKCPNSHLSHQSTAIWPLL